MGVWRGPARILYRENASSDLASGSFSPKAKREGLGRESPSVGEAKLDLGERELLPEIPLIQLPRTGDLLVCSILIRRLGRIKTTTGKLLCQTPRKSEVSELVFSLSGKLCYFLGKMHKMLGFDQAVGSLIADEVRFALPVVGGAKVTKKEIVTNKLLPKWGFLVWVHSHSN